MASSIQLNSTNNSKMKIEYQGTSGVPKTVVVPDRDMTLAGTDEVIGVNQTWQDVTASRALGTTYTNTTGKPIMCYVQAPVTASVGTKLKCLINGTTLVTFARDNNATYVGHACGSIIIQPYETYRIDAYRTDTDVANNGTLTSWIELR